jgi:hypothetical protein
MPTVTITGATGDLVADDTTPLVNAINAAGTNGVILFPVPAQGYRVTRPLVPYPGQTWYAYGRAHATGGALIQWDNSSANFSPAGQNALISYTDGTISRDPNGFTLRGIRLQNTARDLSQAYGVSLGWTGHILSDVIIEDCEAGWCGLQVVGGYHHRLRRNWVHDSPADKGLGVHAVGGGANTTPGGDAQITDNLVENCRGMGITNSMHNSSTSRNRVIGCGLRWSGGAFSIDTFHAQNAIVANNFIFGGYAGILNEHGGTGVKRIHITNGGSGYSEVNPPTLTIGPPAPVAGDTDSQQATGYCEVDSTGAVVAGILTDVGCGYDPANPPAITISGGGGTGATGAAVIGNTLAISNNIIQLADFRQGAGIQVWDYDATHNRGPSHLRIAHNVIDGGQFGIYIQDVPTARIDYNDINDSGQDGIWCSHASGSLGVMNITNNTIAGNDAIGGTYGASIGTYQYWLTIIRDNTLLGTSGSTGRAFRQLGSGYTVWGNVITGNYPGGIFDTTGSPTNVDFRRNTGSTVIQSENSGANSVADDGTCQVIHYMMDVPTHVLLTATSPCNQPLVAPDGERDTQFFMVRGPAGTSFRWRATIRDGV